MEVFDLVLFGCYFLFPFLERLRLVSVMSCIQTPGGVAMFRRSTLMLTARVSLFSERTAVLLLGFNSTGFERWLACV